MLLRTEPLPSWRKAISTLCSSNTIIFLSFTPCFLLIGLSMHYPLLSFFSLLFHKIEFLSRACIVVHVWSDTQSLSVSFLFFLYSLYLSNLVHCIFQWCNVSYYLSPPSNNNLTLSFIFVCHIVCVVLHKRLKEVKKLTPFVLLFLSSYSYSEFFKLHLYVVFTSLHFISFRIHFLTS